MKIEVLVKTNAKQNKVQRLDGNQFLVWVKAKPQEGQANRAIIEALAEYFDIAKSKIELLKGQTSKQKVFDVEDNRGEYEGCK